MILEPCAGELAIRDWLMSCRVLTRGVEQSLMNAVFEHARRLGLPRVSGEFIPTAKNGMVREFFAQFGFAKTEEDSDGHSRWSLDAATWQPLKTWIAPAG